MEAPDHQEVPATIRAMIQLAHGFGIWVLAQGVETKQQFALLRKQGCDFMQGWLHSPALTADELIRFLHNYDQQAWLDSVGC